MSLIINQGKQTIANQFQIIEEKGVKLLIEKIEIDTSLPNTLRFTFRILSGTFKNFRVSDRVQYSGDKTWKYQQIRAAANVPYDEKEPAQIDIEALLLNRAIDADLSKRTYVKDGENKEAQNIVYKKPTAPATEQAPVTAQAPAPKAPTFDDDDLPFSSGEDTKAPVSPAKSTVISEDDWD